MRFTADVGPAVILPYATGVTDHMPVRDRKLYGIALEQTHWQEVRWPVALQR